MTTSVMRIAMHAHHAGTLFSFLPSFEARIEQIKQVKPADEQELRLELAQDVTDLLPQTPELAALASAQDAFDSAGATYVSARDALASAWDAWLASFDGEAFHKEHCHPRCPWDGKTIFAKGTSVSVLEETKP